jgi:hypothetical protein
MDEVKKVFVPSSLKFLPYFGKSSSSNQHLYDFLSNEAPIGIIYEDRINRFLQIPKGSSFFDILPTIKGVQTGNILFFFVSRFNKKTTDAENAFSFDFPLSFPHENNRGEDETFLLKALLIHYPDHYVTFVRRSFTDRFLKIDDAKVTEAPIEKRFVHLALYLKCPQ